MMHYLQNWNMDLAQITNPMIGVRDCKSRTGGELDIHNSADSAFIDNMANSCPFINGYGVYKARVLLHAFGHYNNLSDKYLCNAVGMYKNGNNVEPEMNLNFVKKEIDAEILIYPNPFSTQITLEYKLESGSQAEFVVYDLIGNKILNQSLSSAINKVNIDIPNLSKGVYIYRYSCQNGNSFIGKLIKE
jgi:hypothetical protein